MISSLAVRTGEVTLPALDGANPLGFLAALGTLVTLSEAGEGEARLRWRIGRTWTPVIEGVSTTESAAFSRIVARGLRGRDVPPDADAKREEAQKAFEAAGKLVKKKLEEIKRRGLSRDERKRAHEAEVRPLEQECDKRRQAWLHALANAVPRPELALGKRIDCTSDEYRECARGLQTAQGNAQRDALNMLAAFGSDACVQDRSDAIEPTAFQFITGSGHQHFLETVRQLMEKVSPERVHAALFEDWTYLDEGLSMRWDPIEDRRYALMDRDPTASDNKTRTVWMANLLAYRSLVLFPSAPHGRSLDVTGWAGAESKTFTWPIWEFPASLDVVRSLLQLRELASASPNRATLRSRGIATVFRARRIKVGTRANYKLNFSPARAI